MAPSQRGLGVMMKRGRKVLTARPRKVVGLVEAPPRSPWSEALDNADCKQLMILLLENPCRVAQKGKAGFTVVHAAAKRGCLELLDQVFDLFNDNDRFVDEKEGIELSLQELLKAETNLESVEKARLTAFELAWWSMGDYKCRDYLVKGRPDEETFLSYQSKIFGSSVASVADDEESSSPRALLLGVLADHRSLLSETMRSGFEEDVEYNFVADCEELRFHHACQQVEPNSYFTYVEAVTRGCVGKGRHVLKYLFQLRNAQGETPLHLLVKNYIGTIPYVLSLIPRGESGQENAECVNMRDSRGWTALHCASTVEGESIKVEVLLAEERTDVNAKVESMSDRECARATPLHLAVIHNNLKGVGVLWVHPRIDVNALFHRKIYFDDSLCVSHYDYESDGWTILQLAAVAALPQMVKVLTIICREVCICLHINSSMTKDTFN